MIGFVKRREPQDKGSRAIAIPLRTASARHATPLGTGLLASKLGDALSKCGLSRLAFAEALSAEIGIPITVGRLHGWLAGAEPRARDEESDLLEKLITGCDALIAKPVTQTKPLTVPGKEVAAQIKTWLKQGLTKEKIAAAGEISMTTYGLWVKGAVAVPLLRWQRFCLYMARFLEVIEESKQIIRIKEQQHAEQLALAAEQVAQASTKTSAATKAEKAAVAEKTRLSADLDRSRDELELRLKQVAEAKALTLALEQRAKAAEARTLEFEQRAADAQAAAALRTQEAEARAQEAEERAREAEDRAKDAWAEKREVEVDLEKLQTDYALLAQTHYAAKQEIEAKRPSTSMPPEHKRPYQGRR